MGQRRTIIVKVQHFLLNETKDRLDEAVPRLGIQVATLILLLIILIIDRNRADAKGEAKLFNSIKYTLQSVSPRTKRHLTVDSIFRTKLWQD